MQPLSQLWINKWSFRLKTASKCRQRQQREFQRFLHSYCKKNYVFPATIARLIHLIKWLEVSITAAKQGRDRPSRSFKSFLSPISCQHKETPNPRKGGCLKTQTDSMSPPIGIAEELRSNESSRYNMPFSTNFSLKIKLPKGLSSMWQEMSTETGERIHYNHANKNQM